MIQVSNVSKLLQWVQHQCSVLKKPALPMMLRILWAWGISWQQANQCSETTSFAASHLMQTPFRKCLICIIGSKQHEACTTDKKRLVTFCCLEDQAIFYHLTWPWDVMPCHFQYTFHLIISHLFPSLLVARLIQNQKHLFTWLEGDCGRGWFLCLPGCPGLSTGTPVLCRKCMEISCLSRV